MQQRPPHPDAVIFDVDGVLVDTEGSYTESVVQTVHWLLVHDADIIDDGAPIDRATVRRWKSVSGLWNDDWDLSYAMYCWLLAADGATTTARRQRAEPAERAAARTIDAHDRATADVRRMTWEEVRGVFEEIYNGTSVAVRRYGVAARVDRQRGLAETERVLIDPALLPDLAAIGLGKVGILTGRTRADWEQVARRLPFGADVPVATMEDGRKPDLAPLRKLVRELEPRAFVAVGDTRADLELIQRWNESEEGRSTPATAVMLAADPSDRFFAPDEAVVIRSLARLPGALRPKGL